VNVTSTPPLGNINIENRNGSVTLTVPENSGFSVSAETTDGDLDNDFSLPTEGTDTHKHFTGTVGRGGPTLRISTSQADVSLKKATILPLPPSAPRSPKLSITNDDGSSVQVGENGVRIISSSPGGSNVIVSKDGVQITTNASGGSVYVNKGTELTTHPDGSFTYVGRDGTRYTSNSDGSKNYVSKGTHISVGADGTRKGTDPNGKALSDAQMSDRLNQAERDVRRAGEQRDAIHKSSTATK
jgi:Putative adhesin